MENLRDRIERLCPGAELSQARIESLEIANGLAVSDDVFITLVRAARLSRGATIVLPPHRYEHLSRGRGWARMGQGGNATWGDRVRSGYRVSPGRWVVGATDGFRRKDEYHWKVKHIMVGDQTWTMAE